MSSSRYFNIIGQLIFPSSWDSGQDERVLTDVARRKLAGNIGEGYDSDEANAQGVICWIENVWVHREGGGPFPTMKQGGMVKYLRDEYGPKTKILFFGSVYEQTHLRAYGLIEITWENRPGVGDIRVYIKPNGEAVSGIETIRI